MSDYISWSETAWATQEERLAVDTKSMNLHIGLPKEREMNEHRILLTPESVQILTRAGHSAARAVNQGNNTVDIGKIR